MAPGGPWEHFCAINAPNGATATHLVTFLIFGSFFAQKHGVLVFHRHRCGWLPMSLCSNHTMSLCGNRAVSLCGNHREQCGQAASRKKVAPILQAGASMQWRSDGSLTITPKGGGPGAGAWLSAIPADAGLSFHDEDFATA